MRLVSDAVAIEMIFDQPNRVLFGERPPRKRGSQQLHGHVQRQFRLVLFQIALGERYEQVGAPQLTPMIWPIQPACILSRYSCSGSRRTGSPARAERLHDVTSHRANHTRCSFFIDSLAQKETQ